MQIICPTETLDQASAGIACMASLAGERAGFLAALAVGAEQRAVRAAEIATASAARSQKLKAWGGMSFF
jgi:hypothetical protein